MATFEQLWAIARNTYLESVRQPVVLVILTLGIMLTIMSNPFAGWTMQDDQRMFVDLGLSTVFISTALLAAFIATNAISREIENRTVLTVISKPVPRPVFVVGKYIGVSITMLVSLAVLALVFMLVEVHGTMQTVRTPFHLPVLILGGSAILVSVVVGAWMNFLYGKNFAASCITIAIPLLLLAYVGSLFFDAEWASVPASTQFEGEIWKSLGLLALATMVLNAVAIAASTRLGHVLTLSVVLGTLLLGLLSDWFFGRTTARLADEFARLGDVTPPLQDRMLYWTCETLSSIVPNFQIFWTTDALTQKKSIPLDYILYAVPYSALLVIGLLALATALFQRREVG
ncbi:MAG: ABC transporter permease [Phycisphaerales bacterium]|nr:ABC transporter permease [Phycisphaerales bacterium]